MKIQEVIQESTMTRLMKHIRNSGKTPFVIMTSWRSELSNTVNKTRFREFGERLKKLGYGFIKLWGVGQEEIDGEIIRSEELSAFIPNMSFEDARWLARRYEQFAFIYSGPETQGRVVLFDQKGVRLEDLGEFRPFQTAMYYSELRKKPFTFGAK